MPPKLIVMLALASLVSACGPDSEQGQLSCLEERVTLPNLDALLPSNMSVRQQLGASLGQQSIELKRAAGVDITRITPNSDGVMAELGVVYEQGAITLVRRTKPQNQDSGIAAALRCRDRVELPVRVTLQSQDGAFQEAFPALLYSELGNDGSPPVTYLDSPLPMPRQGSFQVAPPPALAPGSIEAHEVSLFAEWTPFNSSYGRLIAYWQSFPLPQPDGSTQNQIESMNLYNFELKNSTTTP